VPINLLVELLITDDVGATDIISPPDSLITGVAYPIQVEVANFGSEVQSFNTIFQVAYTGSPNIIFADTLLISNMADSSTEIYLFNKTFAPILGRQYTFTALTTLSSDQAPGNDAYSRNADAYDIVSVWYGNLDGSPMEFPVNDTGFVDVYISTPVSAYIGELHLCLGGDYQYIDEFISGTHGTLYYPLTEWNVAEFSESYGSPPNEEGWLSQSFIGSARLSLMDNNPWLHTEAPALIMSFAMVSVDNDNIYYQTYPAIGPGLNPTEEASSCKDTLGAASFILTEQFSELYFTETPSGCDYLPGDANSDGLIIGSDVTYLVTYFRGVNPPPPDSCWNSNTNSWHHAAGDANGDCLLIGSDVTFLVGFFRGVNPHPLWCIYTPPLYPPTVTSRENEMESGDNIK
jgi:hypothetical protein